MNFDIEDRAMNAINDSPYSVYRQSDSENIPLWMGRNKTPKIKLATPKTLVERIARKDDALIRDIGKDHLITNLSEHAERVYNKINRNSRGVYSEEVIDALDGRLPYILLHEIRHKPENGSKLLNPYAVGSFLTYHDVLTNNEKTNRKSKIVNDRRHFRRNLEAHLGLHVFRDEEVQALVDLSDDMLRNEGYPSLNEKGFFNKYHGHLENAEDVLRVLFSGQVSQEGFNYIRPAQYVDEHGFTQSRDGRSAAFLNRYNRSDTQLTKVAARETAAMMKRLQREGTELMNGQLFAEAQKRVITETIERDNL